MPIDASQSSPAVDPELARASIVRAREVVDRTLMAMLFDTLAFRREGEIDGGPALSDGAPVRWALLSDATRYQDWYQAPLVLLPAEPGLTAGKATGLNAVQVAALSTL